MASQLEIDGQHGISTVRDLFLHALFARMAMTDDSIVEFRTIYDPDSNTIDLDIPPSAIAVLDQVTGMQRGDNLKTFINWLIGSRMLAPNLATDPNFISALSMRVWFGANLFNFNSEYLSIILPTGTQSILGYNLQVAPAPPIVSLVVYLVWSCPNSINVQFAIRTTVTVNPPDGSTPTMHIADTAVDTTISAPGIAAETAIMRIDGISAGSIVSLLLNRGYSGSPDQDLEAITILGLRTEFNVG
jgi:hypothetical protein